MDIKRKRILTFLLVGGFNTLLDIVIFTLLIIAFGRNPLNIVVFNIVSFSLVMLSAFFLNGKYTFKDKNLTNIKFIKYYASSSFSMILNTVIVTFFMTTIGTGTVISKIIAACIIVVYNYTMCRKYIFMNKI